MPASVRALFRIVIDPVTLEQWITSGVDQLMNLLISIDRPSDHTDIVTHRLGCLNTGHCVATVLGLAQTDFRLKSLLQEESIMSKGQDSKKNVKKKPLLTAKEKKAAKAAKKSAANVLGN